MAIDDAGIEIYVSATADKDSAKKAASELTKSVLGSLKDGYIEIPAAVSEKFDKSKASDKLIKAQADFIKQWKKMSAEGFSSSEKDVQDFVKKFEEFKSLMNKEGKSGSKQNRAIRDMGLNELVKSYKNEVKKIQTQTSKATAKITKTSKKPLKRSPVSDEEIDANIKAETKRRYKGADKLVKGYKSTSGADLGRTNKYEVQMSEVSPYKSNWALIQEKHRKEEEAKTAASLKIKKVDESFKEGPKGRSSRKTTEGERNYDMVKQSLKDLRQIVIDNEKGKTELSKEQVTDQLGVVYDKFQKAGYDLEESSIKLKDALEKLYSDSELKRLGGTKGGEKGVGPGHEIAKSTQKYIYDIWSKIVEAADPAIVRTKRFAEELATATTTIKKQNKEIKDSQYEKSKAESRKSEGYAEIKNAAASIKAGLDKTAQSVGQTAAKVEENTSFDKIENSAERVADSAAGKNTRELISVDTENAHTGFDTDAKANEAIQAFKGLDKLKEMMCPCETVLQAILTEVQSISKNGINVNDRKAGQTKIKPKKETGLIPSQAGALAVIQQGLQKALVPVAGTFKNYYEGKDLIQEQKRQRILEEDSKRTGFGDMSRSTVTTTVKDPHSWITKLKDVFAELTKTTANYETIMAKTSKEQDDMNAARVARFGLNTSRNPAESGDKIRIARSMSLWRGRDKFKDLFGDIDLSKGVEVDTTKITDKLAKALSGSQMFKAQTGGWKNNLAIAATGGLASMWQPSLEKSRAQADGVNQIMANIREAANDILQDIQDKESKLSGLKTSGDLKFTTEGKFNLAASSDEAKVIVAQLEESKQVLASILGDAGVVDQVVGKTHGKIKGIIKNLGFTSPILRKNNAILANLNAGLDKSGKALKHQTRFSEMMNYTFQLISRHIGQMVKRLLLMLNPLSLIKKGFQDFASYDVKWQRTMNVIKYNIRRIIRPFMEWLAQKIVNVIGFINLIIQGVGKLFGKNWDLFDQAAADAEKTREEFEKINNAAAGFDELHDISGETGENDPANDLLGDIYKPEIPEGWRKVADKIVEFFSKVKDLLQWCIDHWKLLVGLWAAFKIAKGLLNLLGWARKLKSALSGISKLSFLDLFNWFTIILGIIGTIKTVWDSIKWAKDWGAMLPKEREEQGDKNVKEGEISGTLLGAGIGGQIGKSIGGVPGQVAGTILGALIGNGMGEAAVGTFNHVIATWHGDDKESKHSAEQAGEGWGKVFGTAGGAVAGVAAGAKIGAVLGTTVGPVGTAVGAVLGGAIGFAIGGPIGKAVGSVYGDMVNGLTSITRGKGDFQKLKVSAEDVEKAAGLATEKTQNWNKELSSLKKLEKETGENGKKLYDEVDRGKRSYYDLSDAQKSVYDQYKKVIEAESEMKEAKKQSMEYSAKQAEQLGKESGNFKDYIKILQQGMEDGTISQKDMYDYFAQTYGKLDADAKKVFGSQLPSYVRESVKDQAAEYETFGNKLSTSFKGFKDRFINMHKSMWTSIKEGWNKSGLDGAIKGALKGFDTGFSLRGNNLTSNQATAEDAEKTAKDYTDAQERQKKLQEELDGLQRKSKTSAEELYKQLKEGKVTYEDLSTDQQNLVNKYVDLRDAMKKTDEAARINTETIANIDYQTAKTSGNYDTFIQHLIDANARGEIDTNEMYDIMGQAYADLDTKARESFTNQATEHGLMVDNIKNKATEHLGIIGNVKLGLEEAWNSMKNTVSEKAKEMWENATTKFNELKTNAGEAWQTIKDTAVEKWEEVKTSIGTKVQEIWGKVTSKVDAIKSALGKKWSEIKSAASTGWKDIKTTIKNWIDKIWSSVTRCI